MQLKYLLFCSYMFRSNWTIIREHFQSLAKVTILWNPSVKVYHYMLCGAVVANISGCEVCTACRVVSHTTRQAVHSLKYLLPKRRITYNDVVSLNGSTIV